MSSAPGNAHERPPTGRPVLPGSSDDGGQAFRFAARTLHRGLGLSIRAPELLLVVLLVTAAMAIGPAIGGASTETIDACGTTISSSGEYALSQDVGSSSEDCIVVDASDVTIDGQGYTITADGVQGITRGGVYSNVTVRNVTVVGGDQHAINFNDVSDGRIENVTVTGANIGIKSYNADVVMRDVVVRDTSNFAIDAPSATVDAERVGVGNVSESGSTVSFQGNDFGLEEIADPAASPDGNLSLSSYLNVNYINGYLDLGIHYTDDEVAGIDESTLALWRYESGSAEWVRRDDSSVDTTNQIVSATDVSSGDVGAFGEEGPYFDVTIDSIDGAVTEGETVTVDATVENTGYENGTQTVALTTDGVERATETLTLNVSETATVTFEWSTTDGDAGLYTAAVESEADSDSRQLRVDDPDGPIWNTGADWDGGTHQRTVSDDVGDRSNDTVRLGYPADSTDLVGYWPFDEDSGSTAIDAARSNDGAHEGAALTLGEPGLLNASRYRFDGSNRVNVSNDPSVQLEDGLAVSVWLRTTSLGNSDKGDNQMFFVDKGESYTSGYELFDNGDNGANVVFRVNSDGNRWDATVPRSEVNDGDWHNIVGVRDGDAIRLYLDGQEVDETTGTTLDPGTRPLLIGSSDSEVGHYEGDMDEVRIYDRALGPSEVQSLYDTTRNGTYTSGWRPLTEPLNVSSLQLNGSATVPDGNATITVESDTNADGIADETSDPIGLSDGTANYDVAGLSTDTDVVRLRTEFETPDPHLTPVLDRAALEEPAEFRVTNATANESAVVQGETVAVNATVENVGDLTATKEVTLDLNGSVGRQDSTNVTLDGGENQTVTLEWPTTSGDRGGYEATVATEDDSDTTVVRVDAPAYFDVTVTDTSTPIVENETLRVDASVENTGDLDDEQTVDLTMDNGTVAEVVNSTTLALGAGASENVTLEWTTGLGDADEYDAVVASENDSDSDPVSVVSEEDFQVTVDETNQPVVAGETLWVNATVENLGGSSDAQDINLSIDDGGSVDGENVSLNGGEQTTVNLTWTTTRDDVGERLATVSSDDGSDAVDATVLEPTNFSVGSVTTNSPVLEGSSLDVTANVTNVGDVDGSQALNLSIDGTEETATTVALNASESRDVTLSWQTASGDAGDYTAAFASENDTESTGVRVDAPANLSVDVVAYDAAVVEGEALSVTANVTNVGDRQASQGLNLTVDGSVGEVDDHSVTVDAGASQNVTLSWPTQTGDAGDYSAEFYSENDSEAVDVRVDAPANLSVDVEAYDDTVVEGKTVTVDANVTNVGDVTATQNATLSLAPTVGDDPVASEQVVLDGGNSTTVSLTWTTSEGDSGTYDATVSTENDSQTVSVTVQTPPNVSVSLTDAPASIHENERAVLNATVENLGEATANQTIALNVSSATTASERVATEAIELGGGNATEVSLAWAVDANATGVDSTRDYTATVASENDSDDTAVQVRDAQAYFVSVDGTDSPVTEGETVTVGATVSVHDGTGESKNVSLHVGGAERDRTSVTLTGQNDTSVSLSWATESGDAGDYTATVASEDDSAAASVTVESDGGGLVLPPSGSGGSLDVAITDTNEPVPAGETAVISARVSNGADEELTETITLSARGSERDSQSVTLGANESRSIDLRWETTEADAGSHPVTVAGSTSSDVRYVDVESAAESAFSVEIQRTTSPIDAGRPLRVTASIAAAENDTQTIELRTLDGETADSTSVSLAAGESTTVTLTWNTGFDDAGSGHVTVRSSDDADSASVQIRRAGDVAVSIDALDTPLQVNESGGVGVTIENEERGERTVDVVLEIDGTERDVRTVTLGAGARSSVSLSWVPTESDVGVRDLTVRAGRGSVTERVTVEDDSGGFFSRAPGWTGAAVDYEPTEQDTHVGGFLWLTALIGGAGLFLLVTRSSLDGRLLAATLLVAAFRTSTDVVHAAFDEVATEQLLALNTALELYVGLLFLAFAATYVDTERVLRRRTQLAVATIGIAGTVLAATNARHGLVFGEVSLVGGPFTYVTAEMEPVGWAILVITLSSLFLSVGLLARSFLAGTDPTWRPVGVLAAGLCMAVVIVLLSVFERGPLPQYDYTGAGVGGFLIVATTTAVGHGLHRITHDAQKSLIQDLDDPIVIANDARVVVEYNVAAADLLPGIDDGVPFHDLVSSALDWPAPGETTTGEYSRSELVASPVAGVDPDDGPIDAMTDGAGREAASDDGLSAGSEDSVPAAENDGDVAAAEYDGDVPPAEDGDGVPATPSDEQEPQSDALDAGDSEFGSTDTDVGPTDTDAEPTDTDVGPTDTDAEPTDTDVGPTDSVPETGDAAASSIEAQASQFDAASDANAETDGTPSPTEAKEADTPAAEDDHFLVQTTSVTADTGDSIGYTVRFTDVTELKRRTEELTRRNAQLEQVASTISHDLRNPMTVADGYVDMIQDTVPTADSEVQPATIAEHLEPVRESLGRMDDIIADILALARSDDTASEERLAFGMAAEEAWATVDTGSATLFVESAGTVTADPGHLRRIFENLFRNAVEHAGPEVAVLVGLTEDGFYVADDGPGIPEERRTEVFEEGHTSNPQGTGLGLSIVSQLARDQGWDVHLDSEYSGARFVLTGCETETDGTGPSHMRRDE